MEMNYTVYMHVSPSGKRYIGITSTSVNQRWRNGKGYKENNHFTNAIKKYGWDNFEHIIIVRGLDKETAEWLEIELIREWDSTNQNKGYNISIGGKSGNGCKWTEEHKQQMSERMSGENNPNFGVHKYGELNPMYGKTRTEEWRQEHSKRMSGENNPMYGLKGELNPNYGKHFSQETRDKMSKAKQGKKHSKAILYKVINSNGDTVGIFYCKEIYNNHSEGFLDINQKTFNKYIEPFGNIDINRLQSNHHKIKALREKLTPYNGWQFIEISKEELETEIA